MNIQKGINKMTKELGKWLGFEIISLIVFLLLVLFFCTQKLFASEDDALVEPIPPPPAVILDGYGAMVYNNKPYEIKTFNEGDKGYKKVIKIIKSNPDREELEINLNCLSAFHAGYDLLEHYENCDEILNILNNLLSSDNLNDVQATITEIYYDFDISSGDKSKHIVRSLEKLRTTSKDEYTVRFATLCLNKMYAWPGVRKDTYPVPSIWEDYKKSTEK